jgi:long-chain acyl-CoA synthetase
MATSYEPVHHLLENSADCCGDSLALVHGDLQWTYAAIEARANQLANLLIHRGVQKGDRVALLAENGMECVSGLFGIMKAGACVVALSPANKPHTNNKLMADAGCVALVTRLLQVKNDFHPLVESLPRLQFVVTDRQSPRWDIPGTVDVLLKDHWDAASTERPHVSVTGDDLCNILYTSGSTGMPRGATLTHNNLAANTRQILSYLDLEASDSVMVVLPFHYSFGNSLLLTHMAVGGKLVVDNRFAYPQTIMDAMTRTQVTGFSGVPSTYAILSAKSDFLTRPLPNLRYLTQAGGGMAPSLIKKIQEAFASRAKLYIMYGQTEASARLSYVPPEKLSEKLGSIGIPIPGVDLSVVRADNTICDVGEVGEVVARGDNIMRGYWDDPQETALVLRDRALYTGDLGRKDADGYIFLVDRAKDMIKSGANRVSSREIEDAIMEIEGVVEVCVVGESDELLGEAIVAHVVISTNIGETLDNVLGEKEILLHLRKLLPLYKIPRKLQFHKSLPKNSSGKIRKSHLRKG